MARNSSTMVDEEYDVTLKGADIENSATIEDLFNTVKSKKEWHFYHFRTSV